jgi:timeless
MKKHNDTLAGNTTPISRASSGASSLLNQLKKERQQMHAVSASRHSHFAGTLVQQRVGGHQRYRTASVQTQSQSRCGLMHSQPHIGAKKKTKKHHYFIGPSHVHAIYTRSGAEIVSNTQAQIGPVSLRAQNVLHTFCVRFMTKCYGPVMKSLKNEFRRDSSRLEANDKVVFFRLIWFFSQWWRVAVHECGMKSLQVSNGSDEKDDSANKSIGPLIFTMDVFMFNIVLMSTDFFHAHKKYKDLAVAVSLYTEMMHLLGDMYHSSDSTEQIMAMGLMDRLFYQSEPMDRIPKLLSNWIPGTFTRDYVCDLLELTHTALKLLESNSKACESYRGSSKKSKKKKNAENTDAVERMRTQAADFDVIVYMARKIISNASVFIFTQLLSQYNINANRINHHIISFFVRLCKFIVASDRDEFVENEEKVTLEPMLFNLPLLIVLNQILNDASIQGDKSFEPVLAFASTVARHFARAAEKNPMLYVEILFRHPAPHRFCESLSNMYVTEDLLLIAEREMLHEQSGVSNRSAQLQSSQPGVTGDVHASGATKSIGPDDGDNDEVEFDDGVSLENNKASQTQKNNDINSDDESSHSDRSNHGRTNTNVDFRDNYQQSNTEKELDEEEDKWNDRRSFVPKRKLISRKEVSNDTRSKTNDDQQSDIEKELDEEEEKWNDRRSFVPKRKLISREEVSNHARSKTNDDQQSDVEKELDDEEDKWNDRRSFVSKRKLIRREDSRFQNEDEGNMTDQSNQKRETTIDATQPAPKRIRRSRNSIDSDDEDFDKASKKNDRSSKRMLLEDSDED